MSKNNRKLLLAALRQGDFAHAGEIEAIDLAMQFVRKDASQLLLDVGCGLGGTADYLEKKGWGKVIGIDRDQTVLDHAVTHYPSIQFLNSDIEKIDQLFPDKIFDVVYSFNAFFCFRDQLLSLKVMQKVAKKTANLILFDYAHTSAVLDQLEISENPFSDSAKNGSAQYFYPLPFEGLEKFLETGGWRLKNSLDLTAKYLEWYQTLIEKMEAQKKDLVSVYGQTTFDELYVGYLRLMDLLNRKKVGGRVVHAQVA